MTNNRDDSRLWGVHGSRGVTDVLGALEHPEGQTAEEASGRQQAGDWTQLETSSLWNEQRNYSLTLVGLKQHITVILDSSNHLLPFQLTEAARHLTGLLQNKGLR